VSCASSIGVVARTARARRLVRLGRLSVWRQILGWAGAWWFAFTLALGQAIVPLLGLVVWMRVLPSASVIGPYYLAVMAVALLTGSFENHTFAQSIYSGDVADELLRPQPVAIGPLGENLAIRVWMVLLGLPLVIGVAVSTRVTYDWRGVLLAVPALMIAALLRFLFTWTFAMAAFWTERVHAAVGFVTLLITLLGGSAAPLSLMPPLLRDVANLLPFRAMLGLPAEIAAGTVAGGNILTGYAAAVGWTAVFGVAATAAWRAGVRRYTSVGG